MQSTTTRFSDEEYEALVAIAKQQERSQNEIIREALRSHPDIQIYLKAKKTRTYRKSRSNVAPTIEG